MTIDNEFEIGQTVYLVTDPDQLKHLVTGIKVEMNNIYYHVSFMSNNAYFEAFELSHEKDELMICGIDGNKVT